MLDLAFSSLNATLTASPHGCVWHPQRGFEPVDSRQSTTSRVVLIAALFSVSTLDSICAALSAHFTLSNIKVNPHNALSSVFAVDVYVDEDCTDLATEAKACLTAIAEQFNIDVVALTRSPKLSEPGLLIMDMDSTMIQMECIDEIARLADRYEQVAAVTAQAMNGNIAFSDSLKTRVACLHNVDITALAQIRAGLPLMPGLWPLVSTLKRNNWKLAIASGGFTYFADYLKEWLELDAAVSNQLEIKDGKLTGQTTGVVVDAQVKAQTLVSLQQQWGIGSDQTVAIGDGANDLPLLKTAALGVAFHAKPNVRAQASYAVNAQPLDAVLLLLES